MKAWEDFTMPPHNFKLWITMPPPPPPPQQTKKKKKKKKKKKNKHKKKKKKKKKKNAALHWWKIEQKDESYSRKICWQWGSNRCKILWITPDIIKAAEYLLSLCRADHVSYGQWISSFHNCSLCPICCQYQESVQGQTWIWRVLSKSWLWFLLSCLLSTNWNYLIQCFAHTENKLRNLESQVFTPLWMQIPWDNPCYQHLMPSIKKTVMSLRLHH